MGGLQLVPCVDSGPTVEEAVGAILNEHCPDGVPSVVDAAAATGRIGIIIRDHANDEDEQGDAS
jgi:hypothetical protein